MTNEAIRILQDEQSELDFKMIDNALRNNAQVASMILPFADNW